MVSNQIRIYWEQTNCSLCSVGLLWQLQVLLRCSHVGATKTPSFNSPPLLSPTMHFFVDWTGRRFPQGILESFLFYLKRFCSGLAIKHSTFLSFGEASLKRNVRTLLTYSCTLKNLYILLTAAYSRNVVSFNHKVLIFLYHLHIQVPTVIHIQYRTKWLNLNYFFHALGCEPVSCDRSQNSTEQDR